MITQKQAERLAREWIDAFNRHDLDTILAHYADDVEFTSPAVIEVMGEASGTLRGKATLREYFGKAIARYPDLGFELLHVFVGVDSVALVYRSLHRDRLGVELMQLSPQALVTKSLVLYAPPWA